MKKDIPEFVNQCLICQQVKFEYQRPSSLPQQMPLSEWKWDRLMMDFVVGLPRTSSGYDDRLTKSAHFLPVKTTYGAAQLAKLYIERIVCLHGVLIFMVSNRGPQFTSQFWRKLQEELGTRLDFSTTFHPRPMVSPSIQFRP